MAEWSIAAVLKTVDCQRSGGSNPSLSAKYHRIKKQIAVSCTLTAIFVFSTYAEKSIIRQLVCGLFGGKRFRRNFFH